VAIEHAILLFRFVVKTTLPEEPGWVGKAKVQLEASIKERMKTEEEQVAELVAIDKTRTRLELVNSAVVNTTIAAKIHKVSESACASRLCHFALCFCLSLQFFFPRLAGCMSLTSGGDVAVAPALDAKSGKGHVAAASQHAGAALLRAGQQRVRQHYQRGAAAVPAPLTKS
jgi:hypothetical protein